MSCSRPSNLNDGRTQKIQVDFAGDKERRAIINRGKS